MFDMYKSRVEMHFQICQIYQNLTELLVMKNSMRGVVPRPREACYRLGTANSNTVNSKFHLIRSLDQVFARFLSFHV